MKGRTAFIVALLVVALGGALWLWKGRHRDTAATKPVTHGSGSAVVSAVKPAVAKQGRITVTVKDDKGPVGDAYVRLAPEEGDVVAIKTGKDGVAVADRLAAGEYEISASAVGHEPGALAKKVELAATDDAKVTIDLKTGGRALVGTVTDVSGGPIAGARIDAAKLGTMARPDRAVATALTGADGKYQLTVAEGQLMVAARSPDYSAQSRIVDVGPSGATADFALVPGGVIEGVVLDDKTRAPIAGAIVNAQRDTASILLAETSGAVVSADADGKFRITGLRPGAYELGAVGDGRHSKAPTIVGLGIAEQVTDVEILVGKAPVVRGVVIDDSGAPVKNARVHAIGDGRGEDTKADANGAFVIEGLTPGKYMLIGSSPEHFGPPTPIEIKDADVDHVTIRVHRGAKLVGRVEPAQICDVTFAIEPKPGGGMQFLRMPASQTTGPDGKFEISPVDEDKQTLSARCPSGDQGKLDVDVKPGMPEVVIAVKPGGSIAGRVVDGDGKPVVGVGVIATPTAGGISTMMVNGVITSGFQALTNGSGAYEIRGLEPGRYRMGALDRGQPMPIKGKPPAPTLGAAEKKTGVDLAVERPTGVIKGVVDGPDGRPLADAWVSVRQDVESMLDSMAGSRGEDEPGSTMVMRVEERDDDGMGGGAYPPVLTDAQGRFEIRGLPKAKYEVLAEAQAGKVRGRRLGVEPDAEVTITAAGVTSLSGTVTGPTGPVALFSVELDGPTRAERTFTDGKFELGRVDPGSYTVKVTSSDGNAETKVEVKPGTPATVAIQLVANAIVVGTIVDAGGKPLAGVPVTVVDDTGDGSMKIRMSGPPPTTGPDGKFRVEHKAGRGMLVVMGMPPTKRPGLVLEAGKTLDVGAIRMEAPPSPP